MIVDQEKGHTVPLHDTPTLDDIFADGDYTTLDINCQGFTEKTEIEKKFEPKRKEAGLLADSFFRLDYRKRSERVADCGTYLEFAHAIDANGVFADKGKLHNANFCRDRLCPMCAWRRSYKIFSQVSQIMKLIKDDYLFLFLTLTVPNVKGSDLSKTVDDLGKGWTKLLRHKRVKKVVKGYFKALEITRNARRDDYHPHFHSVLAVPKSYFKKNDYIKQEEWLSIWRECMADDTITQVDIRRAKNKPTSDEVQASEDLASAVAEIAKYAVKSGDYLIYGDTETTDKVVDVFASVLHGRRLCSFDRNGAFGKAREQLQLDDAEDGDLIHIDDEKIDPAVAFLIVRYGWSCGVYRMVDSYIKQGD